MSSSFCHTIATSVCYAFKAVTVEFWNYKGTDFDLAVPERDCRKKVIT
jgi:uncharacterized ubiquitin-like protein YukD